MPRTPTHPFPDGKRFAFTVIDDTDVATVANVRPLYDLLAELGFRTTKTVWPMGCPEGSPNFSSSETLEDDAYRAFVLDLRRRGFEITWHGATMESSERDRTLAGLKRYREIFGEYPRIHVNHSMNRENLYWGTSRIDLPFVRWLFARFGGEPGERFTGHVKDSPYWWGDACERHFEYGRNLTTNDVDTTAFNPTLPYRDPDRPLIPWWFSASDAEDVDEFNELLQPANQNRLEAEGGICIVATHFGKRFVKDGEVHPTTARLLRALAARPGWFPPTGELLDWLRARRANTDASSGALPRAEWCRMQMTWAMDLGLRAFKRKLRGRLTRPSM